MRARLLPVLSGDEFSRPPQRILYCRSLPCHQLVAAVERVARGGNRLSEDDGHRPRLEEREPLWLEDGPGAGNRDRNAVQVRLQRGNGCPLLERQQLVGHRSRPFGEEEQRRAAKAAPDPLPDGLGRAAPVLAIDEHVAHPPRRPAEQGDARQLLLGDEAHRVIVDREDGGHVQVRGVVGDEDVGPVGIQLRLAPDDHARSGDAQETAGPGAEHALGELRLAGDPDRRRRDHRVGENPRPAEHRAQEAERDHGALRAAGYSSAAGKSSTSAMVSAPVRSISSRSKPTATPPASSIRSSAARNFSSSGKTSRPRCLRSSCSCSSRWRCSRESQSSEKPLASSSPPAYSSKRSATRGSEGLSRASAACEAGYSVRKVGRSIPSAGSIRSSSTWVNKSSQDTPAAGRTPQARAACAKASASSGSGSKPAYRRKASRQESRSNGGWSEMVPAPRPCPLRAGASLAHSDTSCSSSAMIESALPGAA